MMKNILAIIGALVVAGAIVGGFMFGTKIIKLDSGALPAYMEMFNTVLNTGNTAEAMVLKYKVKDSVENDDVVESIKALAEEYNMRVTGDIKMYTLDDAKDDEVKHARIISLCSLHIAKIFLNYSAEYGAFMPCRIMLIELGNGERFLYTMDLTLMINGGYTLPTEMLELAQKVQKAMTEIPARAAKGDF
jgi:uncharacterized protein (DUF302 family)